MSWRRKATIGIAILLAAGLGYGLFGWYPRTRAAVGIGAAMLAKQVCSCIFVAGRGIEDCRADQFASADAISLELLAADGRVRAWVPGFGERSASHREDFGCTLD